MLHANIMITFLYRIDMLQYKEQQLLKIQKINQSFHKIKPNNKIDDNNDVMYKTQNNYTSFLSFKAL